MYFRENFVGHVRKSIQTGSKEKLKEKLKGWVLGPNERVDACCVSSLASTIRKQHMSLCHFFKTLELVI